MSDSEPDPGPNTVTDTTASPEPDSEPEHEPDTVANTITYTEPDTISDPITYPGANTIADTVANPEPDSKPDSKPDPKPDPAADQATICVADLSSNVTSPAAAPSSYFFSGHSFTEQLASAPMPTPMDTKDYVFRPFTTSDPGVDPDLVHDHVRFEIRPGADAADDLFIIIIIMGFICE